LVDLLYLTSGSDDWDYLRELRLELPDGFSGLKLERVADQCRSSKTRRACRRILELHNNEVGR